MILIVGYGPSAKNVSTEFIDANTVVRLATGRGYVPKLGTRTDIICSTVAKRAVKGIEFWHVADFKDLCINSLAKHKPSKHKPSTGLSAAIIARHKHPNEQIGVIGFDITLHPETAKNGWRHDAIAECKCMNDLGITEYV